MFLTISLHRATDTDTTDEILAAALEHAKSMRYCAKVCYVEVKCKGGVCCFLKFS